MSNNNDDNDPELCRLCCNEFDDDPDQFSNTGGSNNIESSHLPIQSGKCPHNICYECVIKARLARCENLTAGQIEKLKWLECRFCTQSTCFNSLCPLVATDYCELLRKLRKFKNGNAITNTAAVATSATSATSSSSSAASSRKSHLATGEGSATSKSRMTISTTAQERNKKRKAARQSVVDGVMSEPTAPNFDEDSFMTNNLFLLNPFVSSEKKLNRAFGPFIRAGVATPGFDPVPKEIVRIISNASYGDVRNALCESDAWGDGMNGAAQLALWLTKATVGSFVIMRHEYGKCPYLPEKLKDDEGNWAGKVYVIGVITKQIEPGSTEEDNIARQRLGELHRASYNTHSFCQVSWVRMGMKENLSEHTQRYINSACQPTLSNIAEPGKVFSGKTYQTNSERIRQDLWRNATMPISSDDFPEVFSFTGQE